MFGLTASAWMREGISYSVIYVLSYNEQGGAGGGICESRLECKHALLSVRSSQGEGSSCSVSTIVTEAGV